MTFTPTLQQEAIVASAAAGATIMCSAGAGCSKTSTIEMLAPKLPGVATALAFNKSIQTELQARLPSSITCLTMNGLGHRAWMKMVKGKVQLNAGKIGDILKPILDESKLPFEERAELFPNIIRIVSLAKSAGLIPVENTNYLGLCPDDDESWEDFADSAYITSSPFMFDVARRVLKESIRQSYQGVIDFDDQIYMSTLFGAPYERRDIMLVDEAQDLSPINHKQIQRSHPAQLIVVGDPRQAIYGFRGADSNSMRSIEKKFPNLAFNNLPLSTTFRCPKSVVARQLHHYPDFNAFPTNAEGEISTLPFFSPETFRNEESLAILCRNNGPLFRLVFKLLRAKLPVQFLGKDIGRNLKTLLKKACKPSDQSSKDLITSVERWRGEEIIKNSHNTTRLDGIHDRAESMMAIVENSRSLADALALVDDIFSRGGKISLATGHKAKGLEWNHVFHLDPFRVPSKKALDSGDEAAIAQEKNLRYVIETRTKNKLTMGNMENFEESN